MVEKCTGRKVSIHSTQTGRDEEIEKLREGCQTFQSTLPKRVETFRRPVRAYEWSAQSRRVFQSTLPKRVETTCSLILPCIWRVSIHSTQTGRDQLGEANNTIKSYVSIHSTQTGRDETYSTMLEVAGDVSIHSTQTGRDVPRSVKGSTCNVSIHSTQTGRDDLLMLSTRFINCFNPLYPNG